MVAGSAHTRRVAECLFCGIVAKKIPSAQVYEDDEVLAFKDIRPIAPFHVLVIPKRHVESLEDADAGVLGRLGTVSAKLAREAGYGERGYRVVTNVGPDSGQTVFHLHFHVLAGRGFAWPPG